MYSDNIKHNINSIGSCVVYILCSSGTNQNNSSVVAAEVVVVEVYTVSILRMHETQQ